MPREATAKTRRRGGSAAKAHAHPSLRPCVFAILSLVVCVVACNWDPKKPFERESPQVKEAIQQLEAGQAPSAAQTLEEYLATGACADGNIGAPDSLKKLPNGAFDLGLALFKIGEAFGRRFGEEELDGGAGDPQRKAQIECALRVVRAIAADDAQPIDVRARARYLEGNLLFLGAQYEDAVAAYDKALVLEPGLPDAGDPIGRDAAWNRAIALRRIDDKKDAGNDASNDGSQDSPSDAPQDANDAGKDGGDAGDGGGGDGGNDAGDSGKPNDPDGGTPPQPPDGGPSPSTDLDERSLDQLENAPSLQQEVLKRQAKPQRGRGMVDK